MFNPQRKLASKMGILVLCAGFFVSGASLIAGTTGKITGLITDAKDKAPLPGANVLIEGTALGSVADSEGRYIILNVPPGFYTLRIRMVGYRNTVVEEVRVHVDLTTTIDGALEQTVLEIDKPVTVVAERPFVQMDMTSALSTVSSREINSLPVEDIGDVLELQAGLVRDGDAFHIRGGRTGEVAYWVDGVSATDVYNGQMGVTVENSAIEELQVVSGTFNAEYGQAMSGIVNIITKEGGRDYTGQIKTYVGDYVSGGDMYKVLKSTREYRNPATGVVKGIGKEENPLNLFNPNYNVEANLSGPVPFFDDRLSFFANGRYFSDEGYLYGRRWFTPQGLTGDSALVPMNSSHSISAQGKLTYRIGNHVKITYNLLWSQWDQNRSYSQLFKYNPDGTPGQHSRSTTHFLSWNHVLSPSTFYETRFGRFHREYRQSVYPDAQKKPHYLVLVHGASGDYLIDPDTPEGSAEFQRIKQEEIKYDYTVDPRDSEVYIHPDSLKAPTGYSYYRCGMDMGHLLRTSAYWIGKLDLTSQATKSHQVKTGIELRLHELSLDRFDILPKLEGGEQVTPFEPWVPPVSSPYHDRYKRRPVELSAYLQDKIELKDMIMNIGMRFDYFDARSVVPSDPTDPDIYNPFKSENIYKSVADSIEYTPEERRAFMQKKVDPKMRISPRLGIAYPITDRGVIHFSYGHFFQIPEFQYLYEIPDFKLIHGGLSTVMGNADLKPQRTIMYEIGLQQQLTDFIGIDCTIFYRDIRNWVGTSPVIKTANPITSYLRFENKDYSNVRGFTLKIDRRFSGFYSARLDYTYQVAEGSYSNPRDAFYAYQSQMEPRLALIPLAWDQRHTLNGVLSLNVRNWILTLKGSYRTGRPYTPSIPKGELVGTAAVKDLPDNSSRLPTLFGLDAYLNRRFTLGPLETTVFVIVYNVLDFKGEINVFTDTGSADYSTTLDPNDITYLSNRVGTIDDYLRHPDWYVSPRQVQVGVTVGF